MYYCIIKLTLNLNNLILYPNNYIYVLEIYNIYIIL